MKYSKLNQFEKSLVGHLCSQNRIKSDQRVIIAVSGGKDSMVLLHSMDKTAHRLNIAIDAVHVNHHLRDDSYEDQALVEKTCTKLKINLIIDHLDPATKLKGESLEMWARTRRYQSLERIRKEINADWIFTAHHGNDQVETVLMHIAEGTGLDGLKGIREKRGNIIRPLLLFAKAEIEEYAKNNKVPFKHDPTNLDIVHPRNFLRHEVIPNWQDRYPGFHTAVQHLTTNMHEVSEIIDYTLDTVSKKVVEKAENGNIIIKLDAFTDQPKAFKAHLVKYLLRSDGLLWRKHNWEDINHLIAHGKTGSIVNLGHYEILKNRESLIIQKKSPSCQIHFDVHEGENIHTDNFSFKWQTAQRYNPNSNQNVEIVDAEALAQNVELRPWEEGDYFQPLGMQGHKKVSDFLTDIKMDRFSKRSQFVLADRDEVFWVCGRRISDKVKVTPKTTQFAELSFHHIVG